MIILDTDVVSLLIRDGSSSPGLHWLDAQRHEDVWITAITRYELEYGVRLLPAGQRRDFLGSQIGEFLRQGFGGRMLPVDEEAGLQAARLDARRKREGLNVALADTLIAGIALSRQAAIATRNRRHFADTGLRVIDPVTA